MRALPGVAERTLKMNVLNYVCTKCTKHNSVMYTEFMNFRETVFYVCRIPFKDIILYKLSEVIVAS